MIKSAVRYFNTGGLLRDSSILFAGTMGVSLLNFLFQMFMGRYLRKEEYALLAALLAAFNVLATPFSVVVSTLNRYSSLLVRENRAGDVLRLGLRWGVRLALLGTICSMFCFIMPRSVARFLHFDRVEPVYIFGTVVVGVFCRPVVNGMLLGMQKFNVWCVANILGAAIRLLVGVVLVLAISPFAGWGLLGHGIGFYATIAVGMICILFFARTMEKSDRPLPRIEGFMFGSFFILFGHSVLMTADVILIKNLYPDLAPDFAYGATFSRLVLLVPAAFVGSMFPKVVSSGRGSPEQFVFFKRTLLLTLISTTLMAVFISLFARLLPRLLSLEVISDNLVRWMRMFAFITVPVALISVLSRYLLAQQQLRKTICIPVAAVVYVVCSYFIHCGVDGILWTLAATSTGCCLILFALVLADARKVVEK